MASRQPRRQLARVKDVATIEGIRDHQLVGYGLVAGLHGTGDSFQTVFPAQTLISALEREECWKSLPPSPLGAELVSMGASALPRAFCGILPRKKSGLAAQGNR